MIRSRLPADSLMVRSEVRLLRVSSSVSLAAGRLMPMMPLIGVRISWLIVARNCALLALAPIRRTSTSSCSCSCCTAISESMTLNVSPSTRNSSSPRGIARIE